MVGRKIERREEKARGSSGQGSISGYDTVRTPPFQYNSYHPTLAIKIRAHIPGLENLVPWARILYSATASFLLGGVVGASLKELAICLTRGSLSLA